MWFILSLFLVIFLFPGVLELSFVTAGAVLSKIFGSSCSNERPHKGRIAVVIPAYNEEILVKRTIESIKSAKDPVESTDIIVIADNCTDQTAFRAREAGATVIERNNSYLRGKGAALRDGFEQLLPQDYDIFIIVDADTVVSRNFIVSIRDAFGRGSQATQVKYLISRSERSWRTRLMHLALVAFNVIRPMGRSWWGLSAGILGSGFAIHRDVYCKVPFEESSVVEDLVYHLKLVQAGVKVDYISEATAWGEVPAESGAAAMQRGRWEGGRLRALCDHSAWMAKGVISGQWQLIEPLLDLFTLPLGLFASMFLLLGIIGQNFIRGFFWVGAAVLIFHVFTAWRDAGLKLKDITLLFRIPGYIIWKILQLPSTLVMGRKGSKWVRTAREE